MVISPCFFPVLMARERWEDHIWCTWWKTHRQKRKLTFGTWVHVSQREDDINLICKYLQYDKVSGVPPPSYSQWCGFADFDFRHVLGQNPTRYRRVVQLHGVVSTMSSPDEKMEPVLDEEVRFFWVGWWVTSLMWTLIRFMEKVRIEILRWSLDYIYTVYIYIFVYGCPYDQFHNGDSAFGMIDIFRLLPRDVKK